MYKQSRQVVAAKLQLPVKPTPEQEKTPQYNILAPDNKSSKMLDIF